MCMEEVGFVSQPLQPQGYLMDMEGVAAAYGSLAPHPQAPPWGSPWRYLVNSPMKRAPSLESGPCYGSCLYGRGWWVKGEETIGGLWLQMWGFKERLVPIQSTLSNRLPSFSQASEQNMRKEVVFNQGTEDERDDKGREENANTSGLSGGVHIMCCFFLLPF